MPYIKKSRRIELDDKIKDLLDKDTIKELSSGELNYIISNIINTYMIAKKEDNKFNYSLCNNLIGVLECVKLELYDRVITPYETIKIKENGALYNSFVEKTLFEKFISLFFFL
jgi:hypothetical protein